jgi:PAS domain S-box-containing protein
MTDAFDMALLKTVFDISMDGIVVIDVGSRLIIDANPSACSMFGYTAEEFRGLNVLDLTADQDATLRSFEEATQWVPLRHQRRKDGSIFPAEIVATQFEHDGRSVRVGFVRDITARVEIESASKASEAKYASAFRTSPDSVNINRLSDGLYLEINEGFTALTGYTPEDVEGKTSTEISIWADPSDRVRLVELLRGQGFVRNFEASFRFKDGDVRHGLMSARILEIAGEPCILSVTRDISDRLDAERELKDSYARLERMVRDVAEAMGRIVESRDPYTQGHQERVTEISRLIGREMGLPATDIDAIEMAALVHDVGKLAVPAELLNKPGRLSEIELRLIKVHSEQGHAILRDIEFGSPVAEIVLQHHERMDGSGYPQGLSGEAIMPASRILAVADVVEAMASHRPYRPALGLAPAIEEISTHPEKYDSGVTAACKALYERGKLDFLMATPL